MGGSAPTRDTLIAEKGLSIEKGSDPDRLLCLSLALAWVEVEQAHLERSEGRWGVRPRFGSEIHVPAAASVEILLIPAPASTAEALSVLVPKFTEEQKRRNFSPKRLMDSETGLPIETPSSRLAACLAQNSSGLHTASTQLGRVEEVLDGARPPAIHERESPANCLYFRTGIVDSS